MAILSSGNILSEQRWDVSDQRRVESAVRNDFDTTVTSIITNTSQGYIIRGFSLVTAGAIGSAANGLQLVVDGGAVLHINASVSGTIFQTPTGTPNQILNAATNTNVNGSFTANATNYIGLDYVRFADATTDVTKYIWSPTADIEIPTIAPAAQTLTYTIYITTTPWASNVLPIAIVTTNADSTVASISDCRWMLYSLETGGLNPNPSYVYPWTEGRLQPPITVSAANSSADPFIGGDKQLDSDKAWMNAIMSTLLEIKGTPYWFSAGGSGPIPSIITLAQDLGNTVITGSGSLAHGVSPVDKKTLTAPGQINWDQPIDIRVVGSSLTYTIEANPSSTYISLTDDEVAYITLIRDVPIAPNLIFVGGTDTVTSVGSVAWTSGLQAGDYIRLKSDTVAGYYEISTLGTAAMSYADSAYAVTLTTNVAGGDSTGAAGAQSLYAFGSYEAVATPSTSRDIYISTRENAPVGANLFWLFLREDNGGAPRVYVKFLGEELDDGQDVNVDGTTSNELLLYIGGTSMTASTSSPIYTAQVSPGSIPEITDITIGSGSTITGGQYFLIYSSGSYREYYVWFKVSGVGSDPMATNLGIEVDILTGDSSTTVASKLATALNNAQFPDFTAVSGAGTVTVTNNSAGATTSASNFNIGAPFAITVGQVGTGIGNFILNDGDNLTLGEKKLDEAIGNIIRLLDEPSYAEIVTVVASGATPPSSINGPVSPGTNIPLPNNSRMGNAPQDYTVGLGVLELYLNGVYLTLGDSWSEVGTSGSRSNDIEILIELIVGDQLEFRININGGTGGVSGVQGPQGPVGPAGPAGMNSAGGPVAVSIKTSSYAVLTTDCFLAADCTSGPITFTLPLSSGNTGRIFYAKKIDNSINLLTIVGSGSDTIDGTSSFIMNTQNQSVSVIANGSSGYWVF